MVWRANPEILVQVAAAWRSVSSASAIRSLGRVAQLAMYFGLSYVGITIAVKLLRFLFQFITRSKRAFHLEGLLAPFIAAYAISVGPLQSLRRIVVPERTGVRCHSSKLPLLVYTRPAS